MHSSRLTTAVALAAALAVPAFTSPAHAATTATYTVAFGFSPTSGTAPVTVKNNTLTPVVFKAQWQTVPQVVREGQSYTFTGGVAGQTITALGSGAVNTVFTVT